MSKTVSIVVPFYNEGAGVDLFFERLGLIEKQLPEYALHYVCIDDGSADDTLQRLVAVAQSRPGVRVIELTRNFGKEAALGAGLDFADGDAVVPMDADLQDPPELIIDMLRLWREGAEVVLARRSDRSSDGYLKRTTAAAFYRMHNRLSQVKIPENVGDFRLMDRAVVLALRKLPERQRFTKGLFAWVGFKPVYIDYVRPERAFGDTKFSGRQLWELAMEGFTSFSTAPLKVWTYIGAIGALLALSYAAYIVLRTLIYGVDVPGYASLLVVVLFMGSVQLLSVGLLGEYIGRIYLETKNRPRYLVRAVHGEGIRQASER